MTEVECRISKIIINERQDGQIIWLQELEGRRSFAVIVGFFEATSLRDRIRGFEPERPMTHHLISNCIGGLGGRLQRVVVTALKDNTYFANLVVERDGEVIRVDARPSDALVLAMQEKVGIFVADEVLSEASKWAIEPKVNFSLEDIEEVFGDEFEDFDAFDDDDDDDDEDDQDDPDYDEEF